MAKNIKLRALLSEQDPRIAGYKAPSDRYLSKTGPNKDGEYELDARLKGIEKAIGQDVTAVSGDYTGATARKARETGAGVYYLAPNGLEYPVRVIGGVLNTNLAVANTNIPFKLDLSATKDYPLLQANPPQLTAADAKIIVNKGRTEKMIEYDIEQIAEKIYESKGYFYDDEKSIKPTMEKYRFGIQNRGDFAFLENTFMKKYGKTLEHFIYEFSERDISENFLKWFAKRPWMTKDVLNRYGDSLDRINDWALASGTINDHFLFAISPTRMAFLKKNYAARDASAVAKVPVLNWLVSKGGILGDYTTADWTYAGQPGNEGQLLPFELTVHTVLGAISTLLDFFPFVGNLAAAGIDLLDAGIYAAEGDTYSAGMAASFAALPFVSGLPLALVKTLKKFSRDELLKFGARIGKKIDVATYLDMSRRELELIYEIDKAGNKLAKNFDDYVYKSLITNADEFANTWKNASKSQKDSLARGAMQIADTKAGQQALQFIEENAVMTAADIALRKLNQVTDAQIDKINAAALKDIETQFDKLTAIYANESVNSPSYAAAMKPNAAWAARAKNNRNELLLTSLLSNIVSEQVSQHIIRNRPDPVYTDTGEKDTTKTKFVKKKSTATIKPDTTATSMVYNQEKGGIDTTRTAEAIKNQQAQDAHDAKWIDASTLTMLAAAGIGIYSIRKTAIGKGVGWLLKNAIWKPMKWPFQYIAMLRDRKKVREALEAAEKKGLTLTNTEYKEMVSAATAETRDTMQKLTQSVYDGTNSPEEVIKYFDGLPKGKVMNKLKELQKLKNKGAKAREILPGKGGATGGSTSSGGAYSRSNIGFGKD